MFKITYPRMGKFTIPIHDLVGKIIAQTDVVHLYAVGFTNPFARVGRNSFDNLAPSNSELYDIVDSMRNDLYDVASRFFD